MHMTKDKWRPVGVKELVAFMVMKCSGIKRTFEQLAASLDLPNVVTVHTGTTPLAVTQPKAHRYYEK